MNESRTTYPDEYLDYWADVFNDMDLASKGYTIEQFLRDPHGTLDRYHNGDRPLLPAQQAVADRLLAEELAADDARAHEDHVALTRAHEQKLEQRGARCSGGRWIEPLHHSAYPRKPLQRIKAPQAPINPAPAATGADD